MNTKILLLTFLTITITLSLNANSQTENFIAASDKYFIDACKCSTTQNNIIIGNTGEIDNFYSAYQTGKAQQYSILSEAVFNIKAGEVKQIIDMINVPCNTRNGEYELNTYVTSIFGQKKLLKQVINIKECKTTTKTTNTTNKTSTNTTNTTNKTTTNNTKQNITSNLTIPDKIQILTKELKINKTDKKTTIEIRNEANNKTSIELSINGPQWITTKTIKAEIGPNQTKNASINLNLTNTTKEGSYTMKIEAKKANNTIYAKNIKITLGNKKFDATHIMLGTLAAMIIIAIITLIIMANKKQEEKETEDIRVEEIKKKPRKRRKRRKNRK